MCVEPCLQDTRNTHVSNLYSATYLAVGLIHRYPQTCRGYPQNLSFPVHVGHQPKSNTTYK